MRAPRGLLLVLANFGVLACLCPQPPGYSAREEESAPAATPAPAGPPIEVSAMDLLDAYMADRKGAAAKYEGRTVRVTGLVNDPLVKDILGDGFIAIGTGEPDQFWELNVYPVPSQLGAASSFDTGDLVTIQGTCWGFVFGSVMVLDARIIR